MVARKNGLALLLAATLALVTFASAAHAAGVIGVRGGVTVASASLDISQTLDKENQTGFAGSAFATLGAGVAVIQPEISYVEKGVKDSATNNGIELNYLELAALVKTGLPVPVVKPHVFGGIAADIEVDKNVSGIQLDTKSPDWNLIFGADVQFDLSSIMLLADGRYALGLTDVSKGSDVVSDLKNRAWIFSAGVGFHF